MKFIYSNVTMNLSTKQKDLKSRKLEKDIRGESLEIYN